MSESSLSTQDGDTKIRKLYLGYFKNPFHRKSSNVCVCENGDKPSLGLNIEPELGLGSEAQECRSPSPDQSKVEQVCGSCKELNRRKAAHKSGLLNSLKQRFWTSRASPRSCFKSRPASKVKMRSESAQCNFPSLVKESCNGKSLEPVDIIRPSHMYTSNINCTSTSEPVISNGDVKACGRPSDGTMHPISERTAAYVQEIGLGLSVSCDTLNKPNLPIKSSKTEGSANQSFHSDLNISSIHTNIKSISRPRPRCEANKDSVLTTRPNTEPGSTEHLGGIELCDDILSTNPKSSLTCELLKLPKYGWYWGPISKEEAEEKLQDQPDGAFLVRDSSADHYLLSLSFRSAGKSLHTRIEYSHNLGLFSFYHQSEQEGFSSIADLIEHSVSYSKSAVFCYSRPRSPGHPAFPVRLTKPVSRFTHVRSLQYLCRFVIREYIRVDNIQKLPLPSSIKGYIEEGHY